MKLLSFARARSFLAMGGQGVQSQSKRAVPCAITESRRAVPCASPPWQQDDARERRADPLVSARERAEDRRRQRSDDAREALSLQLAHVREAARLEALVLASEAGLSVAHAGDEAVCTELAALAPFLPRVLAIRDDGEPLRVRTLRCGELPLLLVAYCPAQAPDDLADRLAHASAGVLRILRC